MNAILYLEGGGDSKELHTRCREGFHRLLERCGFDKQRRMPRLVACGGRKAAFDDFKIAHDSHKGQFIALWLDSEAVLTDLERTWAHLASHDGWPQPDGASDEQVLFMTTCMETWLVTDRDTLQEHYGSNLHESALPPLDDLENRAREDVQPSLAHATRDCSNAYQKGERSFRVLGLLNPATLEKHLPSFARARRILNVKL